MSLPRQQVKDYFTRQDELQIIQIKLLARLANLSESEYLAIIGESGAGIPGLAGLPGRPGEAGAPAAVASPMVPPLSAGKIGFKLPVLYALTQELGWSHHKFTSLTYTTSAKSTLLKDLDERFSEPNLYPEVIIVQPSTDCQVDFDTPGEEVQIQSSTPTVLADYVLTSPLHPVKIHHKATSSNGTLFIWLYWR